MGLSHSGHFSLLVPGLTECLSAMRKFDGDGRWGLLGFSVDLLKILEIFWLKSTSSKKGKVTSKKSFVMTRTMSRKASGIIGFSEILAEFELSFLKIKAQVVMERFWNTTEDVDLPNASAPSVQSSQVFIERRNHHDGGQLAVRRCIF